MERLTLTWTRPDGKAAIKLEFTYPTTQQVSEAVAALLDVLATVRQTERMNV